MPQTPRKRPGGRSARVGEAVHHAVRTLMAERGADGFTGRDVAERAGVNEATIYRRWGTLDNLMVDVAAAFGRLDEQAVIPDTGSLREDLRQWGAAMEAIIAPPDGLALLRAVLAVRTSQGGQGEADLVAGFIGARIEVIQQVLDRASARGESAPTVTAVLDRLIAPMYLRVIFGYGDIEQDLDALIDNTLA